MSERNIESARVISLRTETLTYPLVRRSRIYAKLSHMPVELVQKGKAE